MSDDDKSDIEKGRELAKADRRAAKEARAKEAVAKRYREIVSEDQPDGD